jgi:hypothetical protein
MVGRASMQEGKNSAKKSKTKDYSSFDAYILKALK